MMKYYDAHVHICFDARLDDVDVALGDIDTALDSIIAIQDSILGGGA